MSLSPGLRLGPYELLAPIGAGGMGKVWKARDTRLEREVAIKLIAQEKAGDAILQARFEREARAASALNHPNILSVFDVGEYEGAQYLVSELVQGESLRDMITRGPIPSAQFANIASQIAAAMSAAHRAGIVHRDLKPENIMITTEGCVKVLDFGLARRIRQQATDPNEALTLTNTTQPGFVIGTAGYMSPEQICGQEAGYPADIFSLGVIFYEMLTGARAFNGRTSVEMMSAILKDDPPEVPENTSRGFQPIVRRCLEKDPARRYQSAAELKTAIDSSNIAPPAHKPWRWIAAAGIAVAAIVGGITSMGKRPASSQPIAVVSAPAPPPVTGPPVEKQAAASVKQAPVPDSGTKSSRPTKNTGANPAHDAAYQQAYEGGMLLLSQRKWAAAIERLTEAIKLKPDSAAAYLGRCHAAAAVQDHEQVITDCSEVIKKLPASADAFHERGLAYLLTEQHDGAVEDMNAAIRLGDKEMAPAHSIRGRAHAGLKEWGDAIQDFDEAIRLSPETAQFYVFRGMAFTARSQFRKAIDDFNEAIRLQPNMAIAYTQRSIARQRNRDFDGAVEDRKTAMRLRKQK